MEIELSLEICMLGVLIENLVLKIFILLLL